MGTSTSWPRTVAALTPQRGADPSTGSCTNPAAASPTGQVPECEPYWTAGKGRAGRVPGGDQCGAAPVRKPRCCLAACPQAAGRASAWCTTTGWAGGPRTSCSTAAPLSAWPCAAVRCLCIPTTAGAMLGRRYGRESTSTNLDNGTWVTLKVKLAATRLNNLFGYQRLEGWWLARPQRTTTWLWCVRGRALLRRPDPHLPRTTTSLTGPERVELRVRRQLCRVLAVEVSDATPPGHGWGHWAHD